MNNLTITEISQYTNSPIISAIISKWNESIDPVNLINDFYNNVWNLKTAVGWGLDVWGKIVGVSRIVYLPTISNGYFGFNEAGGWLSWGQGYFWNGDESGLSSRYTLSDSEYRLVIQAKAYANISDSSAKSVNHIIQTLFGNTCYVLDNLDMTMTLVFPTALSLKQLAILLQTDVVPRPMGVLSYIVNGTGNSPQHIIPKQVF